MNPKGSYRGVNILSVILALILLVFLSQPMMAQSQNISGTVADATGGLVPDAAVTITDAVKGETARCAQGQ